MKVNYHNHKEILAWLNDNIQENAYPDLQRHSGSTVARYIEWRSLDNESWILRINGIPPKITVEITIPFAVLFGAFLSGWLQYRFVFKGIMDKAGFWILYSVIGWLLATLITMSTTFINIKFGEHFPKVLVVFFALSCLSLGGPILGLITGQFIVPRIKSIRET